MKDFIFRSTTTNLTFLLALKPTFISNLRFPSFEAESHFLTAQPCLFQSYRIQRAPKFEKNSLKFISLILILIPETLSLVFRAAQTDHSVNQPVQSSIFLNRPI